MVHVAMVMTLIVVWLICQSSNGDGPGGSLGSSNGVADRADKENGRGREAAKARRKLEKIITEHYNFGFLNLYTAKDVQGEIPVMISVYCHFSAVIGIFLSFTIVLYLLLLALHPLLSSNVYC